MEGGAFLARAAAMALELSSSSAEPAVGALRLLQLLGQQREKPRSPPGGRGGRRPVGEEGGGEGVTAVGSLHLPLASLAEVVARLSPKEMKREDEEEREGRGKKGVRMTCGAHVGPTIFNYFVCVELTCGPVVFLFFWIKLTRGTKI